MNCTWYATLSKYGKKKIKNPGQLGLGSSRPGSTRRGQLGLLYLVYGFMVAGRLFYITDRSKAILLLWFYLFHVLKSHFCVV